MQDQPKSIAYRENTFYKDGTGSRPLVEGTVPRGYLREDRALYLGKKPLGQAQTPGQPPANPQNSSGPTAATGTTTSAPNNTSASLYPDDVETFPFAITKEDLQRGQERYDIFVQAVTERPVMAMASSPGADSTSRRPQVITRTACGRRRWATSLTR
jgi:hypothetical protein